MPDKTPLDPFQGLRENARLSDPFTLGGRQVRFRLLDQREHQWCRVSAMHAATAQLLERFPVEQAHALLNHPMVSDTLIEAQEVYILSSALCNEAGAPLYQNQPDDAAKAFADAFSPVERSHLAGEYFTWAVDADPTVPTDSELDALAEEVKKNPLSISLRRCGSNTLRSLCLILARQLAEPMPSPITESSDGGPP